jgi:type II secretory pathway predicted ATPase ExeA
MGVQTDEVREVAQRCEIISLPALDADLEAYLALKFSRAGTKLADVMAPDAIDAIRARLVDTRGSRGAVRVARSMCYPLVVNNLTIRALNAAAVAGMPRVDAQVIAGC